MRQPDHQHRNPRGEDAARQAEAAAILRRVREETEPQTGALAARLASRLGNGPADGGEADRIELWGTRIGRGMSLLVFALLVLALAWRFGS